MDNRKRGQVDFGNGGFKKSKPEIDSLPSGIGNKSKPCTKFFRELLSYGKHGYE